MTIRQICEKSGLKTDTVRYYERTGLISAVKGAYFKNYDSQTLEALIAIKKLRSAGLSITEIKRLLSIDCEPTELNKEQLDAISEIIDTALQRIEARIKEISEAQLLLSRMHDKIEKVSYGDC